MDYDSFLTDYKDCIDQYQIDLTDKALKQTGLYFYRLMQAQERINLTAYRTIQDFVRYHLLDTLKMYSYMKIEPGLKLMDVGSGGGVPGLLISALDDWEMVTLVESVKKKAEFLETCGSEMELNHLEVYAERSEDLAHTKNHREKYDIVTARALAPLSQAIELTAPFVKLDGNLYLPRGTNESHEISSELQVKLGIRLENSHEYSLPEREDQFSLLILKKTSHTHEKFPRKPGKIKKNPL